MQKAREDIREEMDVNVNLSMLSSQMRIISSSYKELVGKQRLLGTHWIDKINRAEGGEVIISSYTVADAFLESNSKIISIARLLHSIDQQNKGIMIIDIPVQYIRHLCETVNLGRNGFIAVLDDDDVVLYHSNEQQVGTTFRQKILTNTGEKPYSLISIDNSEMLVSQIRANYSGYAVLGAVATSAIYRQIGQLQSTFLVAMLVLLMLSIAAIWVVTHNLTKPIVRMSHMMQRIEQGDFSP